MPDTFEAVLYSYLDRRIAIIPVPFGRKNPAIAGWPSLKVTRASVPLYFPPSEKWNVGFLNGDASGGLVDVDLDCPEAIAVAPYILQTDTSIFGRASKRSSHWLYYSKINADKGVIKFTDPKTKGMLVELRCGPGTQTILPGSMHESGEPITWEKLDDIAAVDGDVLEYQVSLVAAAALLARYTPGKGSRHQFYLVVGGLLARCGFERHKAELVAQALVAATGDEERKDRVQAVVDAGAAHKQGKHTFGLTELKNIVGQEVGARIGMLLGYHEPVPPQTVQSYSLQPEPYTNGYGYSVEPFRKIKLTNAATIVPRALKWLWPNRFAIGKIGILAGMPDRGKGLIGTDMAARISMGAAWPLDEGYAPCGSVLVLTAEDDPADTIVPRLMAANANLNKVEIVRMERHENSKSEVPIFSLITDLRLLEDIIKQIGDVRMLWIDPVSAYMGVKKADTFRQSDVRGVLTPLAEMANNLGVFILGTMHFNKNEGVGSSMLRISDSLAFVAAARHAFVVVDQPDTEIRLFAKAKNNLAPNIRNLEYGIGAIDVDQDRETGAFITAPHVIWTGYSDVNADQGLASSSGGNNRNGRPPVEREQAKEFVRTVLANGPMPGQWVIAHGIKNGHTKGTIVRASQDLGVLKRNTGRGTDWTWELPSTPTPYQDN